MLERMLYRQDQEASITGRNEDSAVSPLSFKNMLELSEIILESVKLKTDRKRLGSKGTREVPLDSVPVVRMMAGSELASEKL